MAQGRKIGHGEGFGSGDMPNVIRGKAVDGGDDFYVQKLDRTPGDAAYERANGWYDSRPLAGTEDAECEMPGMGD